MTLSIFYEFEKYQKELLYKKLSNEYDYMVLNKINNKESEILNEIITFINTHNKNNIKPNYFDEHLDDYAYSKNWNKLTDFHKSIKIKEFVNEFYNSDEEILKNIMNAFINKKLSTSKSVEYDPINKKIISIKLLSLFPINSKN